MSSEVQWRQAVWKACPAQKTQHIQIYVSISSSAWEIRNGKDFRKFAVTVELIRVSLERLDNEGIVCTEGFEAMGRTPRASAYRERIENHFMYGSNERLPEHITAYGDKA